MIALEGLEKVKNSQFGTVACDYYGNGKGEFFMTRQQIGQALEYENPQKAIDNIHTKHKDRLDKFSVTVKLRATDGKAYNTTLYCAKGVYEICRWSRQPKADEFYDHVYDILEGLRLGYLKLTAEHETHSWTTARQQGKITRNAETSVLKNLVDYARGQDYSHEDRFLYMNYTRLADKICGISKRDNATVEQLTNLTVAENIILHCVQVGIEQEKYYKDIYQDCKKRLEMFKDIAYLESEVNNANNN